MEYKDIFPLTTRNTINIKQLIYEHAHSYYTFRYILCELPKTLGIITYSQGLMKKGM